MDFTESKFKKCKNVNMAKNECKPSRQKYLLHCVKTRIMRNSSMHCDIIPGSGSYKYWTCSNKCSFSEFQSHEKVALLLHRNYKKVSVTNQNTAEC